VTDLAVGSSLREARLLLGLTREALGAAIGASARTIKEYEDGRARMSPAHVAAASERLDIPLSFFFQERLSEPLKVSDLTPAEIELIRRYRSIESAERRARVLSVAREAVRQEVLAAEEPPKGPVI
jgi:transcriptional regulator with XRE-family HTH domain